MSAPTTKRTMQQLVEPSKQLSERILEELGRIREYHERLLSGENSEKPLKLEIASYHQNKKFIKEL